MDQIPRDEIGYMQVQFKIFRNGDEYDLFGINAFDECFCTERDSVSTQHQVVDDEAKVYEKIFQIELVLKASNYTVMMHMPIHQSEEWEFLGEYEDYEIYFYCILGENTTESIKGSSEQVSPNKLMSSGVMSEVIHFKTSLFDVSKERENPINPIYGLSLLEWLRAELASELVISEPDAEDWGWYSELEFEGNRYVIGSCALFEQGNDPTAELEWVFQVDKCRSFKEKLFGKNKMNTSDSCFVFFKELFENTPEIKEVQIG